MLQYFYEEDERKGIILGRATKERLFLLTSNAWAAIKSELAKEMPLGSERVLHMPGGENMEDIWLWRLGE